MATPWNLANPFVLLTQPIEQLQKLAKQAEIKFTDEHILEKVLTKICQTRDFESALEKWKNIRPAQNNI